MEDCNLVLAYCEGTWLLGDAPQPHAPTCDVKNAWEVFQQTGLAPVAPGQMALQQTPPMLVGVCGAQQGVDLTIRPSIIRVLEGEEAAKWAQMREEIDRNYAERRSGLTLPKGPVPPNGGPLLVK